MAKKPTESSDFRRQLELFAENFVACHDKDQVEKLNKKINFDNLKTWANEFKEYYRIDEEDLMEQAPFIIGVFAPKFALFVDNLYSWFFPEGVRLMQTHTNNYDFQFIRGSWKELMLEQWEPFPTMDGSEIDNDDIRLGYEWGQNVFDNDYDSYAELSVALYLLRNMDTKARGEFLELCIESYNESNDNITRRVERKIKEAEIESLKKQWQDLNDEAKIIVDKIEKAEKELDKL